MKPKDAFSPAHMYAINCAFEQHPNVQNIKHALQENAITSVNVPVNRYSSTHKL